MNSMKHELPSETQCKRTDARLGDLMPHLFAYAERKRLVNKPFDTYYELEEEWEEYPEGWENLVLGMLAAAAVAGNGKKAGAFVRSKGDELGDAELSLAKRWRRHPWWYCAFEVDETIGDSFLRIRPIGEAPGSWPKGDMPETLLLYSPNTADMYRHGKETFIALLWEGAHAFHTYGVVIGFQAVDVKDLLFFADVVRNDDRSFRQVPLKGIDDPNLPVSDIIMKDPLSFLQLIKLSEMPPMQSRSGAFLKCSSFCTIPEVEDEEELKSEELWRSACEAAGESLHRLIVEDEAAAVYIGSGSPMYDPAMYISYEDARLFLDALSEEAYDRGRAVAAHLCSLPGEPQLKASMAIVSAAYDILEYEDELILLQRSFEDRETGSEDFDTEEEPADPDTIPTKEELEAIFGRLMENYNEGVEEDDESIARSLGVDVKKVAPLRDRFTAMNENWERSAGRAADRFGLSPQAFHQLSRGGVPDLEGVLRMRHAEEVYRIAERKGLDIEQLLSGSPLYRFSRWLLGKAVEEGGISATQAGYVGTKVVREAYERHLISTPYERIEEIFHTEEADGTDDRQDDRKPKKEADWHDFLRYRKILETAKLLEFAGSRFRPAEGTAELLDDPAGLYLTLLHTMCTRVEWDSTPYLGTVPYLRNMAGFLLYALRRLSEQAESEQAENAGSGEAGATEGWFDYEELAERFIAAVPPIAEKVEEQEASATEEIGLREFVKIGIYSAFLQDFAESLGLIEIVNNRDHVFDAQIRPTSLFSLEFDTGRE